ncbi:hypothetical protein F66182_10019 [Fusarium sp. NRRL 66182]|nr:hypothetical protein F66182_10019 [Fusarium sp. NRRL 66182]
MKTTQTLPAAMLLTIVAAGPSPDGPPVLHPEVNHAVSNQTAKTVVTTISTDYIFYCPEPTEFRHKGVTYTATVPTYLTITNCPCTVTHTRSPGAPIYPTVAPGPPAPPPAPEKPAPPAPPAPPMLPSSVPVPEQPAPPSAPSQPAPPAPEQPAVPPPQASPPAPVAPTGTAPAEIPVAAASKANSGLGALAVAGIAALVI